MRRTELRPPRLYRVKTAVYQQTRPGLLLDTRMWDLKVEGANRLITPAPEDATWGARLNASTGTRRGLLVVQANPGVFFSVTEEKVAADLMVLCGRAGELGFPDKAIRSLADLQSEIEEPFLLNVVRQQDVVEPWDRPTIRYRCPGTAEVECGTLVSPSASSRLRNHNTPAGERCPRSRTALTSAEREAATV